MTNADTLAPLIRFWEARLELLTQQLQVLKSGNVKRERVGIIGLGQANENLIPDDIRRVESWISELNDLLAKHAKP
jgi:hypothetical protein